MPHHAPPGAEERAAEGVHDRPVSADVAVILVRPARPANVGAAARAMKNFGLSDLRLVGSRSGLPGDEGHAAASALAWKATDVLEAARVFDDLDAAVADLAFVAAATARVLADRETMVPRTFAAEAASLPAGERAGCVFGPEVHGLSNVELDCCRALLRIPSSGEQPSLNLGQAVVIVAYEAGLASRSPGEEATGDGAPAREGDVARLAEAARELLLLAGYLNPQAPEHVLGELRRLVARARPTAREVVLLQGLVSQLEWAVRHLPDEEA